MKLKTAPAIAEKFRIRIKPKSPTSPFNQLANADSNSVFLLTLVQPGTMLTYWTYRLRAPWQTDAWRAQMRGQLRPNAYLRLVENRWVSGEEQFVPDEWWQRCVDLDARPLVFDAALNVWVGVDASVKRDSTAIVVTAWDHEAKKVRLVWHRIFQPTSSMPIDFERDVEATLTFLKDRFCIREVRFDPFQMQASAQRLTRLGLPMVEFPQSVPSLTEASAHLYELIKGGNLVCYDDAALNKAIRQTVAVETTRGWRLAKEKTQRTHRRSCCLGASRACDRSTRTAPADGRADLRPRSYGRITSREPRCSRRAPRRARAASSGSRRKQPVQGRGLAD